MSKSNWTKPPKLDLGQLSHHDLGRLADAALASAGRLPEGVRAEIIKRVTTQLYPADQPWNGLADPHAELLRDMIKQYLGSVLPDGIEGDFALLVFTKREGAEMMCSDFLATFGEMSAGMVREWLTEHEKREAANGRQ